MTSQQMYTIFTVAILRKFNTTQELTPGKWTGLHQLQTGPLPLKKQKTTPNWKEKHIKFPSHLDSSSRWWICFEPRSWGGTIFCNHAKPWRGSKNHPLSPGCSGWVSPLSPGLLACESRNVPDDDQCDGHAMPSLASQRLGGSPWSTDVEICSLSYHLQLFTMWYHLLQ